MATASSSNSAWDWAGGTFSTTNVTSDGLNRNAAIAAVGAPCGASGAGYDCNGNLTFDGTRTFAYDPENRLLSESGPVAMTLAYDPMGRLNTETANGATTQFLYDGDALVAEYQNGSVIRRYAHGPAADNPVIEFDGTTAGPSNASYLIADRQGSIVATANSSGTLTANQTYDAYGVPNQWTGTRFRYTGQIALPEAQLYYYKARIYDPVAGRFLQTDPVGYGPDPDWYVYVGDDPVNKGDATGMRPWELYSSFAEATLDASDDAVRAMNHLNNRAEFGTKILRTIDGKFVYGPVVSTGVARTLSNGDQVAHWDADASIGPIKLAMHSLNPLDLLSDVVATVHSHPWDHSPSVPDKENNIMTGTAGAVSNIIGHTFLNVPSDADIMKPGNYVIQRGSLVSQSGHSVGDAEPGALNSVRVNADGSVTGNYAAPTGSHVPIQITVPAENPVGGP